MSNVTCEICKSESNNSTELGEKVKHKKMVVHLFCLVSRVEIKIKNFSIILVVNEKLKKYFFVHLQLLSSNLMQRADEDEELLGFLISDIEKEIRRASHLVSTYDSYLI